MASGIEQRPCRGYTLMLRAYFGFFTLLFAAASAALFRFYSAPAGIGAAAAGFAFLLLTALLPGALSGSLRYLRKRERLIIKSGIVAQKTTVLPRAQVQCVTLRRNPVQKLFGVCTLVFSCSGGRVRLPGVSPEDARRLRQLFEGER